MTCDRSPRKFSFLRSVGKAFLKVSSVWLTQSLQVMAGLSSTITTLVMSAPSHAQPSTELPPPPSVVFPEPAPAAQFPAAIGDFNTPPPTMPSQVPDSAPDSAPDELPGEREAAYQSPLNAPQTTAIAPFLIYVNGNSPYLLQQVQAVVPDAAVQTYRGRSVILVGRSADQASAAQQVAALNAQGIQAVVVLDREPAATAPSPAATMSTANRYVVIIPARREDLPGVADRTAQLGIQPAAIQQREAPLGTHVAIGPYDDRAKAENISRYLRKNGLDSQVVYRRQ